LGELSIVSKNSEQFPQESYHKRLRTRLITKGFDSAQNSEEVTLRSVTPLLALSARGFANVITP
jgi:hypothetical protein